MPVTKDQAYAIARVVNALRPEWDEPGIRAALRPVAGRNAFDVAMAAIRAAADSGANNPGVIPTEGPHWFEKPSAATPKDMAYATVPFEEACVTCGRSEYWCSTAERPADKDGERDTHVFQSRKDAIRARVRAEQRAADFTPAKGSYLSDYRRNEIEAELAKGNAAAEEREAELERMQRPVNAETGEEVSG